MATIEELRVGCLELRVWLRTAADHGDVAVKKLGDASTQLDALKAIEDQPADEHSLGSGGGVRFSCAGAGAAPPTDTEAQALRSERVARARAVRTSVSGTQAAEPSEDAAGDAAARNAFTSYQLVLGK